MSEQLQIQYIVVLGSIAVAVITTIGVIMVARINTAVRHTKAASVNALATRVEVKNDHEVNLRDDLDAKFAGVFEELAALRTGQRRQGRQINALFAADRELEREIENTKQPAPRRRSYAPKETKK